MCRVSFLRDGVFWWYFFGGFVRRVESLNHQKNKTT